MADDIVTHLRLKSASQIDVVTRLEKKCLCCPCCEEFCLYCETVGEFADAADEIERLRELVEHLSAQLRLQMKANDKAWEAYKEVMGDE
jgi:hypothetical protein